MSAPLRYRLNPQAAGYRASAGPAPLAFHRSMPGYAPTPLVEAPALAAALGVGRLLVKDESCRLRLPSFKILGASWATCCALARHAGAPPPPTLADLRALAGTLGPLTLAAATDGNHGRAVARMARLLGLAARIFVPDGMAPARSAAIAAEGAEVIAVAGSYDDAVARSAAEAGPRCLVISDTAWPGYEQPPRDVIDGYGTIFAEVDAELGGRGEPRPDVVLAQIGVGALAAAVVRHYCAGAGSPRIVGVEPLGAACVLASFEAGRLIEVPGPHTSIMAGLNAGLPSPVAWPDVCGGIACFCAVSDDAARQAMRALADAGVTAGETGAAGVAGLLALLDSPDAPAIRAQLGLGPAARVLTICTEGATDPHSYAAIVGRTP